MAYRMTVSMPDWMMNEIIGKSSNRSERVQELLVKGYMAEKVKGQASSRENLEKESEPEGIQTVRLFMAKLNLLPKIEEPSYYQKTMAGAINSPTSLYGRSP